MDREAIIANFLNDPRELAKWATNIVNKAELSEEQIVLSESINDLAKNMDKYGDKTGEAVISQLINVVLQEEFSNESEELLAEMFNQKTYGEFDKIKVTKSPKNTLIARLSAPRTGNVDRSYIDFTEGQVVENHLQIETEISLSDMRREGAYQVALITSFAIEEFNRRKFAIAIDYIDKLLVDGGENVFTCSGNFTKEALDEITGYLYDNAVDGGMPSILGLSSEIRKAFRSAGLVDWLNEAMKGEINKLTYLKEYNGCQVALVKPGKKTGEGKTLLPADRIFGIAGKIGDMYTKGELRTYTTLDTNAEKVYFKFTGVEFGFCINELSKIAKVVIE